MKNLKGSGDLTMEIDGDSVYIEDDCVFTRFDLDEVYELLHKHKIEQSTNDKVMLHMEFENQNSYTYYSLLSKEECIERLKLMYYAFNTDGAVYFGELEGKHSNVRVVPDWLTLNVHTGHERVMELVGMYGTHMDDPEWECALYGQVRYNIKADERADFDNNTLTEMHNSSSHKLVDDAVIQFLES